ncbi:putative bifunctional diguanylate cyclase/phosphodiesterase [Castellaniella caeni]|uniref:putative bifunctional diguanylate cyclase/phosphodiesterase n=1 Tax=Castellaniella caeni TaxID=266123 RepID=UPI00082F4B86|nr:EAL domain-containing protein [Castellaniella caeni]
MHTFFLVPSLAAAHPSWRVARMLLLSLLLWCTGPWALAATLRVGVPDLPPDIYLQPDGRVGGILADILTPIAADKGLELQAQPCHWLDCLALLRTGAIDLLPNVRYSNERALQLDLNQVPALTRSSLIFAPEQHEPTHWQDLEGKRIAVLGGSVQYTLLADKLQEQRVSASLIATKELVDGFRLVQTGNADAAVAGDISGALSAARYHLSASPLLLESSPIFFAAPKGHETALLAQIDQHLQAWKEDPQSPYYQALAHWGMAPSASTTSDWRWIVLLPLALVSLLAAGAYYHWHGQRHFFDELTSLPSRQILHTRVEQALVLTQRQKAKGALLILDIDDLNLVNERHGLTVGDHVLQEIARTLIHNTYPRDTIARTDGDEFTILLTTLSGEQQEAAHQAMDIAEKLHHALTHRAMVIDGQPCTVRISIGVTLLGDASSTLENCLQEARIALGRAETLGGNRVILFNHEIQQELWYQRNLERDLAHAVTTQQIHACVQPQIDRRGNVIGAELLARWQHPQLGDIPPSRFIPLAQGQGQLTLLTCQMLAHACQLIDQLTALGQTYPLSINVSPVTLTDPQFIQTALRIIKDTGVDGQRLIFEITEDIDLENNEQAIQHMNTLSAQGVRFSIDDFGSGYANLVKLQKLPIHELKIDKSLIDGLPQQAGSAAIVQVILLLARKLKLRTIAEGVEQQAQANFLFTHHCDAIQGYLFSRPITSAAWVQQETDHFRHPLAPHERWPAAMHTLPGRPQGTLASQASVPNFS